MWSNCTGKRHYIYIYIYINNCWESEWIYAKFIRKTIKKRAEKQWKDNQVNKLIVKNESKSKC